MRSLFSKHGRHPATPPPPSLSAGGGGGDTPPSRRRVPKENVDPGSSPAGHSPFRSPTSSAKPLGNRNRGLLPPRPPSSNPLKRKLDVSPAAAADSSGGAAAAAAGGGGGPAPDSGVQVCVARVFCFRVSCGGRGAGSGLIGVGGWCCRWW